ncbi:hypothetical protein MKC54_11015 [[Clostridium] innocuum]|nr:hypothetical protein [[Clostridium] innocuum]MCR0577416.1 hypothetical protein [[Clostridium] innocuum]
MEERKKQLLAVFEKVDERIRAIIMPMIDDMVFLEEQLELIRALPLIRVNPKNSQQQKKTESAKLYRELLPQYMNIVKILVKAAETMDFDEEDPVKKWLEQYGNSS